MKKFIVFLIVFGVLLTPLLTLAAKPKNLDDTNTILSSVTKSTGLSGNLDFTLASVINAVLALVGTIFFILTVYAGIRWMTAQGNEEKVTKAKDTLQAAIIGLVIVFMAYAITGFVTTQLAESGSESPPPSAT